LQTSVGAVTVVDAARKELCITMTRLVLVSFNVFSWDSAELAGPSRAVDNQILFDGP